MKPSQILVSTVYALFDPHEFQQSMSSIHVREIMESIREHGYFHSEPISVYREGRKFVIIDGHHRFEACRTLGIPVLYVIEPKENAHLIGKRNVLSRQWKAESFLNLYAGNGNEHYVKLKQYVGKGLPVQLAASFLTGHCSWGNSGASVRDGTFKVKTTSIADGIILILSHIGEEIPVIKSRAFVQALALLHYVEEFDSQVFCTRALANARMFSKCATRDQALDLIEEIYNFRSREKPLIAGLARQKARERNFARSAA